MDQSTLIITSISPEEVSKVSSSYTGEWLKKYLK